MEVKNRASVSPMTAGVPALPSKSEEGIKSTRVPDGAPQQIGATEELDFSSRASSSGDRGSFDGAWQLYRDAEVEEPTVRSVDHLRKALSLPANGSTAPQTHALIQYLQDNHLATPQNLSYLERIASRHGKTTLENVARQLTSYAQQGKTVPHVSKSEIVSNALHDLAYPSDIDQMNRGTCGATAIQMKLAIERPEQYVSTLTALAQNKTVTTPGGAVMRPNQTWQQDASDGRSLSCRIMQNALMNLSGQGIIFDNRYNSANDENEGGLGRGEQNYGLQQVFGNSNYDLDLLDTASNLYSYVEDDIARGRSVSVSFKGHAVLVVGIDKSQSPHRVIMNSWGAQHITDVADFKAHIKAVRTIDDAGWDNRQVRSGTTVILGDR